MTRVAQHFFYLCSSRMKSEMIAFIATMLSLIVQACAFTPLGLHLVNWDGMKSCTPLTYSLPTSEDDVSNIVRTSLAAGSRVKVIGAGMSFSGCQMSDGAHVISLDGLNNILHVQYDNEGGGLVEVQAGIRIRDLLLELVQYNLTLLNTGATATQSLAGATQTSTHGTGHHIGSIATQLHEVVFVDGAGDIRRCSGRHNKDLFDAIRVGVGALGIVTRVTLKVVPLFKLHLSTMSYPLDKLLVDLPSLMRRHHRLQWSFAPYTNKASVVIREVVSLDSPLSPVNDINPVDSGCWSRTLSTSNCTDLSFKALTDSLAHYNDRALYTEMEMFVPVEESVSAVRDYIDLMETFKDKHDHTISVSVMLRYIAADDILLSPMYKRDSAVISIIVLGDQRQTGNQHEFQMFSSALEKLVKERYAGRPHWGKRNEFRREDVMKVFPESFERYSAVRGRLDPEGIFRNEYVDDRLGCIHDHDQTD